MNFDKIKVSQVLQVIEEDLNVNESASHQKIARLRNALETVTNTYNELFDLDYTPVNMSVNEFIYEIRELSDDLNIDENEQVITIIKNESGKYKIKQIAGLIARRILCYAKEDMKLNKGDRLGFIRFGSRTDIIMPKKITLKVEVGQKVIGGETIIGTL